MVDGWLGNWGTFAPVIPHLAKHFYIVVIDVPGFGDSEEIKERHTLTNLVRMIDEVTHTLTIRQFHLVGVSFGAALVTRFTHTHPHRVKRLVIQGIPYWGKLFPFWVRLLVPLTLTRWGLHITNFVFTNFSLIRFILRLNPDLSHLTHDQIMAKARRIGRVSARAAMETGYEVLRIDLRNDLKQIGNRTLVIDGEKLYRFPESLLGRILNYFFVRPVATAKIVAGLLPNAELLLIGDATHTLPTQKPEEFAKALITFLK